MRRENRKGLGPIGARCHNRAILLPLVRLTPRLRASTAQARAAEAHNRTLSCSRKNRRGCAAGRGAGQPGEPLREQTSRYASLRFGIAPGIGDPEVTGKRKLSGILCAILL
jgi:hypothetical protein